MTMHEDALSHPIEARKVLADHEDLIVVGTGQVFPEPVKGCDTFCLEMLWVVREANLIMNAISADRMLTRLLKVHYDADVQVEHRLDDVVLLHLSSAGPLRTNHFILNHVRVESDDRRIFTPSPLLFCASLAEAEGALEPVLALKLLLLQCFSGLGVVSKAHILVVGQRESLY